MSDFLSSLMCVLFIMVVLHLGGCDIPLRMAKATGEFASAIATGYRGSK